MPLLYIFSAPFSRAFVAFALLLILTKRLTAAIVSGGGEAGGGGLHVFPGTQDQQRVREPGSDSSGVVIIWPCFQLNQNDWHWAPENPHYIPPFEWHFY